MRSRAYYVEAGIAALVACEVQGDVLEALLMGGGASSSSSAGPSQRRLSSPAVGSLNCAARQIEDHEAGTCVDCQPGTHPDSQLTECMECERGKYAWAPRSPADCIECFLPEVTNGTHCYACPTGTMVDLGTQECLDCDRGRFSEEEGSEQCDECPPGEFNDEMGQTSCTVCPAGEEQQNPGFDHCMQCPHGRVAPTTGTVSCEACPTGEAPNGSMACYACAAGKFLDEGVQECFECQPGWFQNSSRQTECFECPPGKFAADPGKSQCEDCPIGEFAEHYGMPGCEPCQDGTIARQPGSATCERCAAGSVANTDLAANTATCDVCPAGKAANPIGTQCEDCDPGSYTGVNGLIQCTPCELGRFATVPGASSCSLCPAGDTASRGGSTQCSTCASGKYTTDAIACTKCPVGTYSETKGAFSIAACLPCPQSTYSTAEGASSLGFCQSCVGQPGVAVTLQMGSYHQSQCVCAAGYFVPEPLKQHRTAGCTKCDWNMLDCRGNNSGAIAKPGHYLYAVTSSGPVVVECAVNGGSTCLGGVKRETSGRLTPCSGDYKDCPEQCSTGSTGFACGACQVGYSRTQYPSPCRECQDPWASFVAMFFTTYIGTSTMYFAVTSMQAVAATQQIPAIYTIMIRSLTSWCLTVSNLAKYNLSKIELMAWSSGVASGTNQAPVVSNATGVNQTTTMAPSSTRYLQFPTEVEEMLDGLYRITGHMPDLMQMMSPEEALTCWADTQGFDPQLTSAFYWSFVHVPIILVFSVIISCLSYQCAWRCSSGRKKSNSHRSKVTPESETAADSADDGEAAASSLKEGEGRMSVSAAVKQQKMILGIFLPGSSAMEVLWQTEPVLLVVLYGLWPQVTQQTFLRPACAIFPGLDGTIEERLLSNVNVLCWKNKHFMLMAIAYSGVALWTLGPIIYLFFRIKNFGPRKYGSEVQYRFGYFFTGMEPDYWWWELIIKRFDIFLFIVIATAPAIPDDRARLLWFTFVSGIFLAVHERWKPYDDRQGGLIDLMESAALASRFSTFLFVSALLLYEASFAWCLFIGLVIFFANGFFALYSGLHIGMDMVVTMKKKMTESLHKTTEDVKQIMERPIPADRNVGVKLKVKACVFGLLVKVFGCIASLKEHEVTRVGRVRWRGIGKGVEFTQAAYQARGAGDNNIWACVRTIFRLTNNAQRRMYLDNVARFADYISNDQGGNVVPAFHVDIFIVLALAHQEVVQDNDKCTVAALRQRSLCIVEELQDNTREKPELTAENFMELNMALWQLVPDEGEMTPLDMILEIEEVLMKHFQAESKLTDAGGLAAAALCGTAKNGKEAVESTGTVSVSVNSEVKVVRPPTVPETEISVSSFSAPFSPQNDSE
eukprot:TRINITY_DN26526_c0_g1_i1.p1 TRINITY_DN26526_c0_g1~~TRINITY_DN26526_c0_g1_i1.p1  ORF type:complete len:1356 (-),score=261.47 TRINITY_DN26526_c0_g1_i1:189-4256(-)